VEDWLLRLQRDWLAIERPGWSDGGIPRESTRCKRLVANVSQRREAMSVYIYDGEYQGFNILYTANAHVYPFLTTPFVTTLLAIFRHVLAAPSFPTTPREVPITASRTNLHLTPHPQLQMHSHSWIPSSLALTVPDISNKRPATSGVP
jgi:hypothetical protein